MIRCGWLLFANAYSVHVRQMILKSFLLRSGYFEVYITFFTSSNYPKCKFILTYEKRPRNHYITLFEKACLYEIDFSIKARFRLNSKYQSSKYRSSPVHCIGVCYSYYLNFKTVIRASRCGSPHHIRIHLDEAVLFNIHVLWSLRRVVFVISCELVNYWILHR